MNTVHFMDKGMVAYAPKRKQLRKTYATINGFIVLAKPELQ